MDLLGPLITSKTRLKLLLRFFLNQNLSGYLQGLSKELDENTNSIRVELNRLEEAGLLSSELQGRRKLYQVNLAHPLTSDITSIVRKVSGIDSLVERVVDHIGENLEQVWILGSLAQGINSDQLEVLLIGQNLDENYIKNMMTKVEKHIDKHIKYKISTSKETSQTANGLQVWLSENS